MNVAPSPVALPTALAPNLAVVLLLMALVCTGSPAWAATHLLDDSASQVISPNARMEWRSPAPGRFGDNDVEALIRVNIRIDMRAWIGRTGRVYMVLPPDGEKPVTAQWQTQGKLLGGKLVSGERGLVYSGAITQPQLEDLMVVYLRADGRWMSNTRRLNFHFELDTE
jgi:hypothetical protein